MQLLALKSAKARRMRAEADRIEAEAADAERVAS
jgi:hypothetical protein